MEGQAGGRPPDVSVVVCTHTRQRLGLLLDCLAALSTGTLHPREVLVVVDDNPELLTLVMQRAPAGVGVLASAGRGVSAARNTGIRAATAELIAFIDDDAVAEADWLAALARAFTDPAVVAAGGRIVPRWEQPNRLLPDEMLWVVGCTYAGHPDTPQPVSRPIGCNMAARRAALLHAGGFPEDFGPSGPSAKSHSNEEIALALRLRQQNGTGSIWYAPDAVVHHFVPAERVSWRYLWRRCAAEGTSKADVRRQHGRPSMDFDRGYVRRTLLPAIWGYAVTGVTHADAAAATRAAVGAGGLIVTAAAYGARLAVTGLRAGRRAHRPRLRPARP